MSAELLRQAATILRERSEAAPRGPWRPIRRGTVGYPLTERMFGTVADTYPAGGSDEQAACTDYIATMHPGVGLGLADLLDGMAEDHWDFRHDEALAIARLLVGGDA